MNRIFLSILWLLALAACADGIVGSPAANDDDTDVIHVGGLVGDELTIEVDDSRAVNTTDAELVPWLINPLFDGFHIAYYRGNDYATKRHAQLKLLRDGDTYKKSESGLAEYSFMETSSGVLTSNKAKWLGNGAHRFEGHYVPEQIRNEVPDAGAPNNLDNDQSDDSDTGNYTLLMRYLSMPTNYEINATIGRVKLPFYHRLCRVNAFVLINPDMGPDVKLEGYDISSGKDDPTTTTLRFENVKVLRHVERTVDDGNEMFSPHWETVRRVIPHSQGEYGSVDGNGNEQYPDFILFESVEEGTPLFPSVVEEWTRVKDAFEAAMNRYYADNGITGTPTLAEKQAAIAYAEGVTKYRMTNYGKVPVYNVIVRPTYTSAENVMYDEPGGISHEETNSITFVLRLNNGLEYEKTFTFDLDANRQTSVYLRINRESVDYNTSGSEVWDKNDFTDGYYGVNNENGNSLSIAGSSWQRAYRNSRGSGPADITDGSDYNENDEADHTAGGDDDGQYISDANWIKCLLQATKDGKHHGDYFILDRDITISATLIPVDFVFTGHLDARGHTITLTDCGTTVTDVAEWREDNYQLAGDYSGGTYYVSDGAGNFSEFTMPDNIYKKTKDAVPEQWHEATQDDVDNHLAVNIGDKVVDVPAQPAEYERITTIAEMMSYAGQLYEKTADDTYVEYTKPTLYVNVPIHHPAVTHTSPSHLFAGLNGIYTTAQESNPALPAEQWEANVHKEGSYWVPVDGYRAEVLNTTVAGGTLFKNGYTTGNTDAADVSGNVQNCRYSSGKVPNYSNGIPKY